MTAQTPLFLITKWRRRRAYILKIECSHLKMSEPTSPNTTCALCQGDVGSGDIVSISEKGADGINKAEVMKESRKGSAKNSFICTMEQSVSQPHLARVMYASRVPYDSTKDCLSCGNKIETSKVSFDYHHYSCVKTFTFVDQILTRCKTRSDAWSSGVQGRIEYFGRDLHAADCMYSVPSFV